MSQIALYELLPSIYRIRDAAQDGQLQAFLEILQTELRLIEDDIEHLYDNWFIETCDGWVVPYIGDLLAVRDLNEAAARSDRQERRTYVANTLAYRQRKGNTAILEQIGRDITGWGVRAVEAQPFVATTQHLSHIRPQSVTVDLRQQPRQNEAPLPFRTSGSFTPEIRSNPQKRGSYTPTGVALYLWRLQNYAIERSTPRALAGLDPEPQGRYFTLNSLGYDAPLFNNPQTETDITELAQEVHVPGELSESLWNSVEEDSLPVQILLDGKPVRKNEIQLSDLTDWQPQDSNPQARVALDLKRGRIAVLTEDLPEKLSVNCSYGFSGDVGGGPYSRTGNTVLETVDPTTHLTWKVRSPNASLSLPQVLREWNQFARNWQACYDLVNIPLSQIASGSDGEIQILAGSGFVPEDEENGSITPPFSAIASLVSTTDADHHSLPPSPLHTLPASHLTLQPPSSSDNTSTSLPRLFPAFRPGIFRGLDVFAETNDLEALVTAGSGIDAAGNVLPLKHARRVYLGKYRNQTVLLVLSALEDDPGCLQIEVVPTTAALDRPYFALARLQLNESGQVQRVDNAVRQTFAPGVLRGLEVAVNEQEKRVTVSPGVAVNSTGEAIAFPNGGTFSLADYRNQVVFLFLQPARGDNPPTLGVVRDIEGGLIELQSNQTYNGDLFLRIPAAKPLYLVAADGDRPHLLGNLTLRGTATPDTDDGGEFTLEGVLLEGNFTVRPGNLQRLAIAHSTIVPGHELRVQRAELPVTDAEPEDITFLALLMYSLTLLQRMLRVGFSATNLPLQVRLGRITEIWGAQFTTLLEALHRFIYRWAPPPPLPPDEDDPDCLPSPHCYPDPPKIDLDNDNSRLSISLTRSICGAIALADSVPTLTLTDCILDATSPSVSPASNSPALPTALTAPGTALDLKTTTVLGSTTARTLEASDSLFLEKVISQRQQIGCLRFCFVPEGSRTPPRYRCQPDLALLERIGTLPVAITSLSCDRATHQTWVGTAGQGISRLIAESQTWVPIGTDLTNLHITALLAFNLPGTGTLAPATGRTVTGSNTLFLQELEVGGAIAIQGEVRTIGAIRSNTELLLDLPFTDLQDNSSFTKVCVLAGTTGGKLFRLTTRLSAGAGRVSSTKLAENGRAIVTGCGTQFAQGDVGKSLVVDEQRRRIEQVISPTQIVISAPFSQDFAGQEFLLFQAGQRPEDNRTTPGRGRINFTRDRTTLTGCTSRFLQQVIPGDVIILGNQSRTVTAVTAENLLQVSPAFEQDAIASDFRIQRSFWEPIQTPKRDRTTSKEVRCNTDITALARYDRAGSGKVTSEGTTVIGQGTLFTVELTKGESLTVAGQTRRIEEIMPDNGSLTINAPFDPPITTPTPFQTSVLLMGTAGNGVFRSTDGGQNWVAINQGLTNLDVRAIATDPVTGECFVGTWGGGVFRSIDGGHTWTGGDPTDETIRQTGLTHPAITGLVLNEGTGDLFAATWGGGVFRSADDGVRWEPVNRGLANLQVTAIASETVVGKGAIASDYTTVSGTDTDFLAEFSVGDTLTAAGQTRRVVAIPTQDELHLDDPFDPDLPPNTRFARTVLYVGTPGGNVFRSSSNGLSWQSAGSGLSQTDIACLTIGKTPTGNCLLLAATRIGSLFVSQDQGNTWTSLNTGLNRVDEMLLLLNQMQPRFTDERYGQPGYAQLSAASSPEIHTGAENGAEMGVFNSLKLPQREDNLRASLEEYLRFGIKPDLIYFT